MEEHWGLACTAPALDAGRALWPAKLKNDESQSLAAYLLQAGGAPSHKSSGSWDSRVAAHRVRKADGADVGVRRRAILIWAAAEGLAARVELDVALDANDCFVDNLTALPPGVDTVVRPGHHADLSATVRAYKYSSPAQLALARAAQT